MIAEDDSLNNLELLKHLKNSHSSSPNKYKWGSNFSQFRHAKFVEVDRKSQSKSKPNDIDIVRNKVLTFK